MGAEAVLDRARELGVALRLLDDARVECRSSSPIPRDLLEELKVHKVEVVALLRDQAQGISTHIADSLQACLALGQRLKLGVIEALRCGITGRRCTACQGVPCLKSTPWDPDEGVRSGDA